MLKKLPVGIQTFSEIRKENYLYIDKTKIALDLIENNKYVFLSRPRRFGKSLFLDTLKNIFQAKKEYFEDLYIFDKWDWDVSYPVINVSFANGKVRNRDELDKKIIDVLEENQKNLGLECKNDASVDICFRDLIIKAYEKYNQKVVILIDEYDKPLLDNITNLDTAKEMKDGLYNFYSVIKGSDEFLHFAFLTGVTKFSKVSIFSGLNNIKDISLNKDYGNICGYTQNDIETSFAGHLEGVDLDKLKLWYNGYNFLGDKVYNPFDVLLFIQDHFLYKNYWFETGTPTFLIDVIKKNNYFIPQLADLKVGEELLNSFHIENIKIETLLFQAGYLTIKSSQIDFDDLLEYTLAVPNKEVGLSLNNLFIDYLTDDTSKLAKRKNIFKALNTASLEDFKASLTSLFASIPYNHYVKNNIADYEGYYASVIYAYLASLGFELIGEDVTNRGRIDLTIKINEFIYVIEFKVGGEDALAQIKEKDYAQKYLSDAKTIYLVGINFDESVKNISSFEWEMYSQV